MLLGVTSQLLQPDPRKQRRLCLPIMIMIMILFVLSGIYTLYTPVYTCLCVHLFAMRNIQQRHDPPLIFDADRESHLVPFFFNTKQTNKPYLHAGPARPDAKGCSLLFVSLLTLQWRMSVLSYSPAGSVPYSRNRAFIDRRGAVGLFPLASTWKENPVGIKLRKRILSQFSSGRILRTVSHCSCSAI